MKRGWKTALRVLLILAAVLAAAVLGYVIYMQVQYYRIEDRTALEVRNPQTQPLRTGAEYTAVTWNAGFGAYDHDFSFFMDAGVMQDGQEVRGRMARAQSPEIVERNTAGVARTLASLDADFLLLQEVDVDATRSFGFDQSAYFQDAFPGLAAVYASNFHSAYLLYPFHEPHGRVEAGLLTLSAARIDEAVRRSYPVDTSFFTKFFDLDRCFSVQRIPVEGGKELVLINSHMSAYDEGGVVRSAQMDMLCAVLSEEAALGNYVIVGGDFNHALCGTEEAFPSQQQVPDWVYPFDAGRLPEGFSVVAADNLTEVATCRSTDRPYERGVNYTTVLDGFLVSDNVRAAAEHLDTDFAYSDHNPVLLRFCLQ